MLKDEHQIGVFLQWAEERLAKAVKEDEDYEELSGTNDYVMETRKYRYSEEEKDDIVDHILSMRNEGRSMKYALDKTGISLSTYRRWLKLVK
mgnify:CR=1 FL=1|jgi:hypothetical protein